MTRETKKLDLTSGPLLPKIIAFSFPLAVSSVLQLLFNAADVVVVGRFAGSEALAAVGSTGSMVNLLVNLFIGFSVGANVAAARAIGAKEDARCGDVVHTSILLALAGGAVLTVVGLLFSPVLLELMGSPENVIGLSALYLRIYFLGMPANTVYNFGAALLRAKGDTQRPLYCLILSGVINVVLNLIFVIVFNLSVAGVALATIISQLVSAVLILVLLVREQPPMRLDLRRLRINPDALKQIVLIGLPAGIQGTLFSLSNVVVQSAVNSFGAIVIAGNSASCSIEGFIYVAMNAFHQACVTFTSQNMGAGKPRNVDRVVGYCIGCVIVVGLALGGAAVLFCHPLLGIYSSDAAVIAAGSKRLLIIGLTYFTCGLMDVFVGALRGLGYSFVPMFVSLIGSCALRLIWVATIFRAVGTIDSLYLCYPVTWVVTASIHAVCFVILRRIAYERFTNTLPVRR